MLPTMGMDATAGARMESLQQIQSLISSRLRASTSTFPSPLTSLPFVVPPPSHRALPTLQCKCFAEVDQQEHQKRNNQQKQAEPIAQGHAPLAAIVASGVAALPLLLNAEETWALNGEFGLLEGRSVALVHPVVMGGLFVYTLWAGYLGWQWRSVRTIQDEINELKKQVKPKKEGAAEPTPSPAELKIKELTEARKELLKGGYRDRHFNAGSILLAFGVLESLGGCLNTWFRTGKLFPGPHLFAGAGITALWALAAALVPAMQKGSETARSLHIALNAVNVLLFVSQIPTGWDIVVKVWEFTTWP